MARQWRRVQAMSATTHPAICMRGKFVALSIRHGNSKMRLLSGDRWNEPARPAMVPSGSAEDHCGLGPVICPNGIGSE